MRIKQHKDASTTENTSVSRPPSRLGSHHSSPPHTHDSTLTHTSPEKLAALLTHGPDGAGAGRRTSDDLASRSKSRPKGPSQYVGRPTPQSSGAANRRGARASAPLLTRHSPAELTGIRAVLRVWLDGQSRPLYVVDEAWHGDEEIAMNARKLSPGSAVLKISNIAARG